MSVKDLDETPRIFAFNEFATAFSDVAPEKMDAIIRKFVKAAEDMDILEKVVGRGDYYDRDLSCFTGTESKPTGLLLAHRKPSNDVEIEYLGYLDELGQTVMALMGSCAQAALTKYRVKPDIILYPDSEELENFLDRFMPDSMVVPMIFGCLSGTEGVELTAEMVAEVMDSLEISR